MRRGYCLQCGKCCEVVCLSVSQEELDNIPIEECLLYSDMWFAKKFFINISKEKAFQINPYLKNWVTNENFYYYYYRCLLYSEKLKKCRLHTYTSRLCKGFPWYDSGVKIDEHFYCEGCGFKIDREILKLCVILKEIERKKYNEG